MTTFAACVQFTEKEILESIKDDLEDRLDPGQYTLNMETRREIFNRYKDAPIWTQFEAAMLIVWGESILFAVSYYIFILHWNEDFWLSVLGFANIIYLFMFLVAKLYNKKYAKYYLDL
jgi:hypothetical protein